MIKEYFLTLVNGRSKPLPVSCHKVNKPIFFRAYSFINRMMLKAYKLTLKFNPLINRFSSPIELNSFVIGSDTIYYEVLEGIYAVSKDNTPGVLKLKVKKKYGRLQKLILW